MRTISPFLSRRNLYFLTSIPIIAFATATVLLKKEALEIEAVVPEDNNIYHKHTNHPTSPNQLLVYWGHSAGSNNASLGDLCSEPSIDLIVVTWVRDFLGANGDLYFDFGAGCTNKVTQNSSDLSTCKDLATDIAVCQSRGKKVLVGIGGAASNIVFETRESAWYAALRLWQLFGDDEAYQSTQPFQGVLINGFDLDHENGSPEYFEDFVEAIRARFSMQEKSILISACASCSFKDPMPPTLFAKLDFVSVRFYNAVKCNWGSQGFFDSLYTWCEIMYNGKHTRSDFRKVFVGLLAFQTSGSGYVPPDEVSSLIQAVKKKAASCFRGVMLWDGTKGLQTKNQKGESYITVVKNAMG